jgi:hypothetical protein
MKRLFIVAALLALCALPSVTSAQDHRTVSKADLTFTEPIVVGGSTLSAGTYKFACTEIDGEHVMIVTSVATGKEVTRVPCNPVTLNSKVEVTEYRSVRTEEGKILTDVRIKGESIAHSLVPPAS